MARSKAQLTEAVNSDSFLDIVASVVSIMIIMVVMEGAQDQNTPVTTAIQNHPVVAELQSELATEESVREDVLKADKEVQQVKQLASARVLERDYLATSLAGMEKEMELHRQALNQENRQKFDLSREVSEARFRIDQLKKEREQAEVSESAPVVLESYSTPISKVVEKYEVHYMLHNNYLCSVPRIETLEQEITSDFKRKGQPRLTPESPVVADSCGPIGGFKMKYRIELDPKDVPPIGVWLKLYPTSNTLGEPAENAFGDGSSFDRDLSKLRPGMHTITIWVYSDSFDAFRKIRKELYHRGFAVAVWPLTAGEPISMASKGGSKSAAQ